ncbi:MAG: ABC transporter ATP-binding protein, partial [Thermomicrobiales bacterium]
SFDGTVLFVSHDRFFMDRIATRIWAVEDGAVSSHLGNYTDYQRSLGRRPEFVTKQAKPEPVPVQVVAAVEIDPKKERQRSVSDSKLQKIMSQTERDIARLEGKLNELSDAMTIAGIDGDVDAVSRLGSEYERTQSELDEVYARWESTSRQIEELKVAAEA